MFSLADVQTTCISLYNFCVSITAVQSLFLRCFSLDHWTIHSTPETKTKKLKTISKVCMYECMFVCMYVCKTCNSDAKHSKI